MDPAPTPSTSRVAPPTPLVMVADEVEANSAAQDAIVNGFDAVATNAVRKARAGVAISSALSMPARMRRADQMVLAPRPTRTAADQAKSQPQLRLGTQDASSTQDAECRVGRVDQGGTNPDRKAHHKAAPQHASHAQEPDWPHLGGNEEPRAESSQESAHHGLKDRHSWLLPWARGQIPSRIQRGAPRHLAKGLFSFCRGGPFPFDSYMRTGATNPALQLLAGSATLGPLSR